ncbi:MAG: anaerobic ribonucleoside-triphosphate reductase activating protein [Bacillota bacterium]|nr:anaerobic ribonucleoside-triphosphate reductase activating protein [Bacillota bacterium]
MLIVGLNKTTLLDYPGRVAATVFMGGCNFRCPFCYNRELVLEPTAGTSYSQEEVLAFLKKRKNILKGVCITGGEPTLQADLPDFIGEIRQLGYLVKLDTNGYKPEVLRRLLDKGYLDYVAMDIKNCPEKYAVTTGMNEEGNRFDLGKIRESVSMLMDGDVDSEFRTTVVKELHTVEDMVKIGEWIKGCSKYYLQRFTDSGSTICEGYHEPDVETMKEMVQAIEGIPEMEGKVFLRGVD